MALFNQQNPDEIKFFRDLLPNETIDNLKGLVVDETKTRRTFRGLVNLDERDCHFWKVKKSDESVLLKHILARVEKAYGRSVLASFTHTPLVYKYAEGVGFVLHNDEVSKEEIERAKVTNQPVVHGDVTIVVGLNDCDEYGGGVLNFPHQNKSFKLSCGDVVFFPAYKGFEHEVTTISHGRRMVCVMRASFK